MNMLCKIDHVLSGFVAVSDIGWIGFTERFDSESDKTMSASEWDSFRKKERHGNSLSDWLKLLANSESRMFHIYEHLAKIIRPDRTILDLGSGQCHVSTLLRLAGYNITPSEVNNRFLLINDIKELNMTVDPVDFLNINAKEMRDRRIDTILAVQVDYIFSDDQVGKLLGAASGAGADVVLVNTQIIGPLQKIKYLMMRNRRLKDKTYKRHGYVRTLGMYRKMARANNMRLDITKSPDPKIESYYFLSFSSR
jgi:hypothetical protein